MKEMCSFLIDEPLKEKLRWACSISGQSRSSLIREGVSLIAEHYLNEKGKELTMEEKIDKIIRRLESN